MANIISHTKPIGPLDSPNFNLNKKVEKLSEQFERAQSQIAKRLNILEKTTEMQFFALGRLIGELQVRVQTLEEKNPQVKK